MSTEPSSYIESATREEQQRVNRGQRELEAERRSNAEEERPGEFARRRLPVQHDERRCLGVRELTIHDFRTTPSLGHVIVLCCRAVEI